MLTLIYLFQQKTAFFIPLMTIYAVQIGIMILVSLLAIGALLYLGFPAKAGMILTVILGTAIFLETYFLLVIRAYYYEVSIMSFWYLELSSLE